MKDTDWWYGEENVTFEHEPNKCTAGVWSIDDVHCGM